MGSGLGVGLGLRLGSGVRGRVTWITPAISPERPPPSAFLPAWWE